MVNCARGTHLLPPMFAHNRSTFAPVLIVDVSLRRGKLGFDFARVTTFEDPTFEVGDTVHYYAAVDYSPSYLWESATWDISEAIIPFRNLGVMSAW